MSEKPEQTERSDFWRFGASQWWYVGRLLVLIAVCSYCVVGLTTSISGPTVREVVVAAVAIALSILLALVLNSMLPRRRKNSPGKSTQL